MVRFGPVLFRTGSDRTCSCSDLVRSDHGRAPNRIWSDTVLVRTCFYPNMSPVSVRSRSRSVPKPIPVRNMSRVET
ncbi:GM12082 [Drosophila sechellia]|uniref:GM12082 n=1 Tax=Drosophila sechellia TaxID=7238 RepID=B4IP63_DROSE|nr:GM12082 [Drosophila sechellia]